MAKMVGRGGPWFFRDSEMRRIQVRRQKRIEEELWRQEESEAPTWATKSAEEIIEDIREVKRKAKENHYKNQQSWGSYFQSLADSIEDDEES